MCRDAQTAGEQCPEVTMASRLVKRTQCTDDGHTGLMDAMDPRTQEALLLESVPRRLQRRSWLFHEGDRSDDVYLVLSGLIKLMKTAADGAEALLAIRGVGEVVGELSAIDARPRLVSAVTIEPRRRYSRSVVTASSR